MTCKYCGKPIEGRSTKTMCDSDKCWRVHRRGYMRNYFQVNKAAIILRQLRAES